MIRKSSTTTGHEPKDKKQKMDYSGVTMESNGSRGETSNTRTYLMKGKAVAATTTNTANANKVAARSVVTSTNTANKVTTTSAATSKKTVNKITTTTTSAATSKKVVKKITTTSVATLIKTGPRVTTRSPATSTKAAAVNKVTIRSPATSTKAVAVNNVSAKIAKLAKPVPVFVCDICTDSTALEESFSIKGCHHKYCKDCVNKYVISRLAENIAQISCPAPNCKGDLDLDHCRSILPQEVFVMWCEKLCEATVTVEGFAKLYCPYKDCSGLLIDDGMQMIKESECPHCRRLFCAQCKVPWHSEIDCKGFQKLHKHERQREDIMLMNLAETKLWKRCPNCKMYVERTDGCRYIKCRCGAAFCYGCGTLNIDLTTHYCYQCRA